MGNEQTTKNREEFLRLLSSVNRRGIEPLINWLDSTDFFIAPASTVYHSSVAGGLVEHSLNVYRRLVLLAKAEEELKSVKSTPEEMKEMFESIIVCSLLHDLCKANFYVPYLKNVKNDETGQWEKVACFKVEDQLPLGHGEKSIIMISRFVRLSWPEIFAIRFHNGDFTDRNTSKAFNKYPLATLLHIADLQATYIDERDESLVF